MAIFILDEIVVKPGMLRAYRTAYAARYVPAAERRGMRLDGAWQSPAGRDYDELPVTLYYMWSVADVAAWWAMRFSRTPDGRDERFEKHSWWLWSDTMAIRRKRSILSPQPAED